MGLFRSFVKYRIPNDFGKERGNKKKTWAGITMTRRIRLKIAEASVYHF
jgi:hypothetical protein